MAQQTIFSVGLALVIVSVPGAADAQISWQPNFNLAPAMLQAEVLNPCPDGRCDDDTSKSTKVPRDQARTPPSRPVVINPATLRFKSNLAVRKQNLEAFVALARNQRGASAANGLQAFLSSTGSADVITIAGSVNAQLGLRNDDVADAFTLYLVSSWMAVRRTTILPSRAQALGLRKQVAQVLLSSGQYQLARDAAKQRAAEEMMVSAILIGAAMQGSNGNPAQTASNSALVADSLKAMGLDLDAMTLGEAGFVGAK